MQTQTSKHYSVGNVTTGKVQGAMEAPIKASGKPSGGGDHEIKP